MNKSQLNQWESAARAAADRLCVMIADTCPDDIAINTIAADDADGTNSLDATFVAQLERREHLTDDFLADA